MRYRVTFTRLAIRHVVVVKASSAEAAAFNVRNAASTMMSSPTIERVEQAHRTTPLTGMEHPAFAHGGFTNS